MPTSHLTQEKEKKFPNALIDVFRTAYTTVILWFDPVVPRPTP
jgi:hypothetical protein